MSSSSRASEVASTVDFLCRHEHHVPTVAAWLHRRWLARAGVDRAGAATLLRARLHEDRLPLALIALADGLVVGTASLVHGPADAAAELRGLYVRADRRGRGIGALLCDRALDEARLLGAATVVLDTYEAAPFFARLGWESAGRRAVRLGLSIKTVTAMERRLVPACTG